MDDILEALIIVTRAAAREKKLAVTLDAALREAHAGLQMLTKENLRLRALVPGSKVDALDEIDRSEKERNGGFQFQGTATLTEAELADRQGIAVRDMARDCSGG